MPKKNLTDDEFFYGHKACPGCGGALALRHALKALGANTTVVLPAGCMSAVGFNFPQLCFANNAMITPFAATAAVASGVRAGLDVQGFEPADYPVIGFAGDGGTADIGIQALSGAIDRDDDIIYFCYDNEAYMNTGIQKSGLTPFGAATTTTPAGTNVHGSITNKKNIFEIVAAHDIKYAATASVGYLRDYVEKIKKAQSIRGCKFIHVIAPCPTGWGHADDLTVEIAREVVDCGLWYLAEFEGSEVSGVPGGKFTITKRPKEFSDVSHYIRSQKRFRAMDDADIERIIASRDAKWSQITTHWN